MNCRTCQSKLALHAGGDLSTDEARAVEAHLISCSDCRLVLESYRQSWIMIRELAVQDQPAALPDGFASDIMHMVDAARAKPTIKPDLRWHAIIFRYGLAACLVASVALLWYRVSGDMARYRERVVETQRKIVYVLVSRDQSLVSARTLAELSVSGPWRLDEWKPSGSAGVFAILHKPDPENHPDEFAVDYLGEASRIEYRGDLWRRQRINRLTERTGSEDNIYIAEYPMPHHSVKERRAVLNTLIDSLQPYYN